jgi:short-subunit dehydrogenase
MGQNITSAAAAAAISSKLLQANGLLVLTGSAAGLSPSSSMIAYATAKSALHFMVESRIPQP